VWSNSDWGKEGRSKEEEEAAHQPARSERRHTRTATHHEGRRHGHHPTLNTRYRARRGGSPPRCQAADITRRQRAILLPGPEPKPAQDHLGLSSLVSHSRASGAPLLRGGQANFVVVDIPRRLVATSPPSTASPLPKPSKNVARAKRSPLPPSPPGLCPAVPLAAAGREGTGGGGLGPAESSVSETIVDFYITATC
jgi:hypothetical protein